MNSDAFFSEVTSRFGTIKRAKKCFLYTAKGVRLIDMYQEGGRAILGWEGGSAFTMFKNVLCRGISGSYNTDFPYRTKKAVETLFASEREVLVYYSKETALKASVSVSKTGTNLFRPWNPVDTKWREVESIVFAPALPWCQPVYIVAVKPEVMKKAVMEGVVLPASEKLPAPLHAAVARSIYNLIQALQEREEKQWFIYDNVLTKYWERKGPYLFPKVSQENYDAFAVHCLECGLVVSPDYFTPSIVPFGADFGVFTKLKNTPFDKE